VIRLGGNTEDRAVDILQRMSKLLRAPIEGYRKTDSPAMIAERFAKLVASAGGTKWKPHPQRQPDFVHGSSAKAFPVKDGRVWIDIARWRDIRGFVEAQSGGLIVDRENAPFITLPQEEFATKDSELLACSTECRMASLEGFWLQLDVPGLDELTGGAR
jgi:hypothetical protein